MMQDNSVYSWLEEKTAQGPLVSEDIAGYCLPLFKEVLDVHEGGKVLPLYNFKGATVVDDRISVVASEAIQPKENSSALHTIDIRNENRVLIREEVSIDMTSEEFSGRKSLFVKRGNDPITRPLYIPHYSSWEIEVDHHDALTDIFHLGMIMASLATGLNLALEENLDTFVTYRSNLFHFNSGLHPVLNKMIMHMTELSRHDRAQDLSAIINVLAHYRQHVNEVPDLPTLTGVSTDEVGGLRKTILQHLRQRLFEFSKRNRLLYFKETYNSLNLTVHSVPYSFNSKHAPLDSLFVWQGALKEKVSEGKKLFLEEYLRFEDYPFIQLILDKIMSEDRRNRKELGFSQLRLVVANLNWHNLKENKHERITSPLLLLPVKVTKKRGLRNHITLEPHTSVAEVNPVLRQYLIDLYGLKLPEEIDLSKNSLKKFHDYIEKIIQASEPGIILNYVDKPQLKIIHKKLRIKLEKDRKRRRKLIGKKIRKFQDFDYCYSADNFHPLGLEMYLSMVEPEAWPLEHMSDVALTPKVSLMSDGTKPDDVKKQSFYSIQKDCGENPYSWDFDLCNMVLGNFNYSKMSLVRDYNQLLENDDIDHPIFDDLFTDEPAAPDSTPLELDIKDSFEIVPNDATQASTISKVRTGRSLIIQGPPGTGKSQTITNLIADYVARGKRVLFVCEKRAAIDVVYNRLKQHGLDQLSCLVHDTKADKKAFVHELRDTYNEYHNSEDSLEEIERSRGENIDAISTLRNKLLYYNRGMGYFSEFHVVSLLDVIPILYRNRTFSLALTATDYEAMPSFALFKESKAHFEKLEKQLDAVGLQPTLGANPFTHISSEILTSKHPLNTISELLNDAENSLVELKETFSSNGLYAAGEYTGADIVSLISLLNRLKLFVDNKLLYLLSPHNRSARTLYDLADKEDQLLQAHEKAQKTNQHWITKVPQEDFTAIYEVVKKSESKWYRFLLPSFNKVKKLLHGNYNFAQHSFPPTLLSIMDNLKAEYDLIEQLDDLTNDFTRQFMEGAPKELLEKVEELHAMKNSLTPIQKEVEELILAGSISAGSVEAIRAGAVTYETVTETINRGLQQAENLSIDRTIALIGEVKDSLDKLPDILPLLIAGFTDYPEIYSTLVSRVWSVAELEKALALTVVDEAQRKNPNLKDTDRFKIEKIVSDLEGKYGDFYKENSAYMIQQVHHRFRTNLLRARANSDLDMKEKDDWLTQYSRGCSEWQHEFNKIMRYKSIRDLASDESGLVLADMKPIWLMSPLSVSDTIPLSTDCFDVVIFDEASQIPLEEAVPALFRAKQAIVVGDEKQLPPTNFFGAKGNAEDSELLFEEDGEFHTYELDADSFLSQASTCFPSSMLGWHYRSRSESLISFSNASFYDNNLMTIPDSQKSFAQEPIVVTDGEYQEESYRTVLERPISFHYLENGIYENRRNSAEATYIAQLLKSILVSGSGESIGIIAFSEAQQSEIESAIASLQMEDAAFDEKLDAAYELEDDGEFRGLFVKNLENVQGDERDIIIISVCYGYNSQEKMLMNFGPINKMGGEKRLNVIFSRAKKHVALVSSIHHTDITNDYNRGANCLKRYLQYAEAVSIGDMHRARLVLHECHPVEKKMAEKEIHPIALSVKEELTKRGWEVDFNVGNSAFTCDIAVREAGDKEYRLGLLLDTERHYGNPNIIEQYIQKRTILELFGWKISFLYMRDWCDDTEAVLNELEKALKKPVVETDTPVTDSESETDTPTQ